MATTSGEAEPLINDNPELQSYYQSLESRVGYRLVLGGTRHFGYWGGRGQGLMRSGRTWVVVVE
ncbi:hypothetical protein Daus18300_007538 [Diaporthe australafricana]|uniref:Uncharacterized protein n=1 Tax=Diaporthe australafricana TaxID=127596 RepID=A0ABR3WM55_9PEZI